MIAEALRRSAETVAEIAMVPVALVAMIVWGVTAEPVDIVNDCMTVGQRAEWLAILAEDEALSA